MKYIFANWKMYLDHAESIDLAERIKDTITVPGDSVCTVFPNTLAFAHVQEILKDTSVSVGAQNVSWVPKGAYTGATSAELFQHVGANYALVGHSERRYIFGETDDAIRKKMEACLDAKITPVVCIGETKEDRSDMKAEYRVKKQIMKLFDGLSTTEQIIVAYEPVWAIGTGDACDNAEAERMITLIKNEIHSYFKAIVPVLYGGSVDEKNAASYLSYGIIDGVLVGSASTDAMRLKKIIESSVISV
ncbi:MAG TPA: triose-phosphate isomerase [Candidatus Magasanikbacteria bacterium]|nr:triose-phosphate isomerase [Candidatus Magasanikbacteria bacterium]